MLESAGIAGECTTDLLASPKSGTLTLSWAATMRLEGFKSRWMILCA